MPANNRDTGYRMEELERRVNVLWQRPLPRDYTNQIASLEKTVTGLHFADDNLAQRCTSLEANLLAFLNRVSSVENRLIVLEAKVKSLEEQMLQVKVKLPKL